MIDKQKAISLKKMAETTLKRIKDTDIDKYASNALKDYYDALHELMDAIAALDGMKFSGEGAHEKLINNIASLYNLPEKDRIFLQELRNLRNRITYEGLFIEPDYVRKNAARIESLMQMLNKVITGKL